MYSFRLIVLFFFFNDTATTEIYTLSLHDALPIWPILRWRVRFRSRWCCSIRLTAVATGPDGGTRNGPAAFNACIDRKSTRLNSSHANISYAVFCLKKKNKAPAHPDGCTRCARDDK